MRRRALDRDEMRVDDVGEIGASIQQLVELQVLVDVRGGALGQIVVLRKEARRAQHDAGQGVQPVHQRAQRFGRELRDAVDILRERHDVLGDPGGRRPARRRQHVAEDAGRAREDERADARRDRLLEQVQRAGHVDVDEVLRAAASRRAACAASRRAARRRRLRIADATNARSTIEPTRSVYADGSTSTPTTSCADAAQRAHQRLAEMARTAGDEDLHEPGRSVRSCSSHSVQSCGPPPGAKRRCRLPSTWSQARSK